MRWRHLLCILGLAVAVPVWGQARVDPDCGDDRGIDRCAPGEQARVRALFAVEPIETHRDAGDQVRRVFYVGGYGRDVVAIAFVRRPGHDPEVRVHFKRVQGVPELAPLISPVPAEDWDLLIRRSAHFDRVPVSPPEPDDPESMSLCLHSWVFTAEATDPGRIEGQAGTVRRRTEDACSDGLTEAFANEVDRAALPLFPHCALLDESHYRTAANQLAACGILSGDRIAAAYVRNQIDPLFRVENLGDLPIIAPLFDYESRIDWNGATVNEPGGDAAARFFLTKLLEAGSTGFFVEGIEGLSDRRVRVRAGFVRFVSVPGQEEEVGQVARAEMIWHSGHSNEFEIQSVTVGPFTRLPPG